MWHDPTGGAWALYPPVELAAVLVTAAVIPVVVMMFRRRGQATMRDETTSDGGPDTEVITASGQGWLVDGGRSADELQPIRIDPEPVAARAVVATPPIPIARTECEHCRGTGYMPGINDLLNESAGLLGEHGDEVVRLFYGALLRTAPDLASLFPADVADHDPPFRGDGTLDADDETKRALLERAGMIAPGDPLPPDPPKRNGRAQREKLLRALVALADLYDPSIPAKMDRLDMALKTFGRSHAAFARPDGSIRAATLEEYAAVKEALFTTLVRFAQDAWKPEYTAAWSQAYDYAAGVMIAEQYRSNFSAPRFPRV